MNTRIIEVYQEKMYYCPERSLKEIPWKKYVGK